jgi:hypothetical protein
LRGLAIWQQGFSKDSARKYRKKRKLTETIFSEFLKETMGVSGESSRHRSNLFCDEESEKKNQYHFRFIINR